jgi:hypothetical protein
VKALAGILIGLVLMAALTLTAGEMFGRPAAEEGIGLLVQRRYQLARPPEVTLDGFPFLVRAVLGEMRAATITLRDYDAGGLVVDRFTLRLDEVKVRLGPLIRKEGGIASRRGTAEARVTGQGVTNYLQHQGIAFAVSFGDNSLTVTGNGLRATGHVTFADGTLTFTPDAAPGLEFSLPVPQITGVQFTRVEVRAGAALFGADVTNYVLAQIG